MGPSPARHSESQGSFCVGCHPQGKGLCSGSVGHVGFGTCWFSLEAATVQTVLEARARQTPQGEKGVKTAPPSPSTPRGQGEGQHAKVQGVARNLENTSPWEPKKLSFLIQVQKKSKK